MAQTHLPQSGKNPNFFFFEGFPYLGGEVAIIRSFTYLIQVKENFSLNIEISLHMCYNKLKRKGHFFQSLYGGRGVSHLPIFHSLVSSCKSNSRIANVPLSVCPSVCQSVTKTPQPIRIAPNNHQAYQPLSLSTIEPIDHQAYRPSSLSTIEPIKHQAYQASSLSTIEPINHRAS